MSERPPPPQQLDAATPAAEPGIASPGPEKDEDVPAPPPQETRQQRLTPPSRASPVQQAQQEEPMDTDPPHPPATSQPPPPPKEMETAFTEEPTTVEPVLNGLQLKTHSKPLLKAFSYALAPGTDTINPVKRKVLVVDDEGIQGDHVAVHRLEPTQKLTEVVARHRQNKLTKAVIVVNTTDGMILEPAFLEGFEGSNYPVLIVSQSDGREILSLVEQEEEDVLCDIEAESAVDAVPHRQGHSAIITQQPRAGGAKGTAPPPPESKATGIKALFKGSGIKGSGIKHELKKLMFTGSGDTPVPLSGESGKFCMVMSVFHNYERTGKPDIGQVKDALGKINKHLEPPIFYDDFPFYLILANRMHMRMSMYQCDESQHFIMSCINMMEKGSHRDISTTLLKFLSASDFTIMFDDKKGDMAVFLLLELACIELCKISFARRQSHHTQKKPPSNVLHERFIYNTMVWVSLSLKVRSHRGVVTRSTPKQWKDHLTSRSHLITLNQAQIDGLKIGLKLGKAIELPSDLRLNADLMCDMLVPRDPSTITVRYFTHLTYFFKEMHSNLSSTDTVVILTYLRGVYDQCLGPQNTVIYSRFSPTGTLAGTLTEGLEFLNQVSGSWAHRKVTNDDLNAQIKAELSKWLQLLLQLIDVTADQAHTHLKQFVKGKGVVKDFQREIKHTVVSTTKQNFSRLPIQQFFPLYTAFMIWPSTFLEDYLRQYEVPKGVKISDGTWVEFFRGISERFSGAHSHYFINDFLQSVAKRYEESKRTRNFVLDLLKLHVPTLLVIEYGEGEDTVKEGEKVQKDFKQFLHNFVRRNALKQSLLKEMSVIMDSITAERDEFQGLVLDVLKKEVVPEFRVLQGEESLSNATIANIIKKSVTELVRNLNWLTGVSPKQSFCWGIVASCCCKVPVRRESLEWVQDYDYLIHQLCHIYKAYCTGQGLRTEEDQRLKEELPKEVQHDDDIKTYFEWVRQVQTVVLAWQERVKERKLNYDEIMVYANIQGGIQSIGDAISASSSILEPQILQQRKNSFLQYFEHLNIMLLRYIPSKPEVRWCTLSSLLAENGVSFPPEVAEAITKYVVIPGEPKEVEGGLLEYEMRSDTMGLFKPGQPVSLKLSKRLGLKELTKLVFDLQGFLEPILNQMEMLVFFKLHNSVMFEEYQKLYLDKEVKELERKLRPPMPSVTSTFGNFPSVSLQPPEEEEEPKVKMSLPILVKSLDRTKELLIKLIEGNATYNEIIAEGRLDLENLDIDREFEILSDFILYLKHTLKTEVGLEGVRCMLELFQYQRHIIKIRDVCEQYKLKGCLGDKNLRDLVELAEDLGPEKSRRELTLNEATRRMNQVKQLLFDGERAGSHCLKLFDAVADSAAFYQFIKDKRFSGVQGQAVFTQQYQLITAQLQHEEYDEQVLNHLFAAYKFMLPFMNTAQDFCALMEAVVGLDTSNGLKQLETVNTNITLIQLWFSRAEGDTLQNVANELECIIDTGQYTFTLSSGAPGGEASMTLEYTPSARPSLPPSSMGEDGVTSRTYTSESFQETGVVNGTQLVSRKENWTREQINDFVRKLGFLDTQKEGGDKIKHFLHINEVGNKLLELHIHLKDLGHPEYLKSREMRYLECSTGSYHADGMVSDSESKLTSWTQSVTKLRGQHRMLLFFSVPKQLLLFKLIQTYSEEREEDVADELVREVMFLVTNEPGVRQELKQNIVQCLPYWYNIIENNFNAMEIVGGFLGDLLQHHALPRRCTKVIRRVSSATQFPGVSDGNQFLHHAPKYQQSQLVRLIVGIYGGVPESFEVFHCRASTTQEELGLFLERVEKQPLRYLILEVNKLPFRLQEYLMQRYLKIQQMARKYQAERENLQSGEHEPSPSHSASQAAATVVTPAKYSFPTIHFVETASSVLRELPWILPKEHKEAGPNLTFEEAQKKCREAVNNFAEIQLVYGKAGDGKTHYIKQQLESSSCSLTIAVNEAFTPLSAIKKLRTLPPSQRDCAVFLNFTMSPPGESVDESEDRNYKELMKVIGWFFFDLILLGYLEDPVTGLSVSIPGGMEWRIYVEVPSRISSDSPEASLEQFMEEVPALGMLGVPHAIDPTTPYTVDEDVQLVCKYLKAYWTFRDKSQSTGINKLYRENIGKVVKFSTGPDIPDPECHQLLKRSWPVFAEQPKVTQKLFIKYMKRRCSFLDRLPAFNYNSGRGELYDVPGAEEKMASDTRELGSTLMSTMLQEVIDFCNPEIKENWSLKAHQQLIYDFKDGGGSFGLLSLRPDQLPKQDKTKFEKIRVIMPSMMQLYSREILDVYLSRALDIELDHEDKRLALIDKSKYVLTLDYTIKMLNIHERYECGVPVIIEGETGVGKTALVEMLSKLWNQSLLNQWRKKKDQILEFMRRKLGDLTNSDPTDDYMKSLRCVEDLSANKPVKEDNLVTLCQLPDSTSSTGRFYTPLRSHLLKMQDYPVISLLTIKGKTRDKRSLTELFTVCQDTDKAETTATLLQAVMVSEVKSTFYKINVHAALTPDQIWRHLQPAIEQADSLREAYEQGEDKGATLRPPFVTVFLDEVNTSSCLGLFKEIIVDRTFDGEPIPDNVFIVAACNPHRGNSLAAHGQVSQSSLEASPKESWTRSTYYVRQLHPTLDFLKWDYGSLDEHQEREYINAKMRMLNKDMDNLDVACLTDLIMESQKLMRKYACEQLAHTMTAGEAKTSSRSCVSQRDIQRVFTFFQWFQNLYHTCKQHGTDCDYSRRAILVSLGIVYYMRLNTKYRAAFKKVIDKSKYGQEISFSRAFEEELEWFIKEMELPTGIAQTQALKENLFATVVCTGTHTPLIIVGAPGSSKTLSFNLTIANLKGQESKKKVFRKTEIFHSLDPHFYQCSRRTTSNEIDTVFSRAINRQRSHSRFSLPIYCVVFMDEAGLPEESHESLKVLHYHLDRQEVSFVAITNHMLDAAKSNRAVCLFRPEASEDDLKTLARGCLSSKLDSPPPELQKDLDLVVKFCPAFSQLMKDRTFSHFFGLRDFIHFVNYLRRRRGMMLNQQLVMEALERNFNGYEQFDKVAESFMIAMGSQYALVQRRSILTVLKDSLSDRPSQDGRDMSENEVRYKLIIDPSEDDSLIRLLFSLGVLDRQNTRMYVCSDFPGDSQIQKINTIAAIRHSAIQGHTVVMSQTDDIHESFYDLFNQRFRRIDDQHGGHRYYTNIAIGAHLRPCRVDPNFQCVVVVKKSEVVHTPAPFLNRFEKYCITHETLLETALTRLPPCLKRVVLAAQEKVEDFVKQVGPDGLYGYQLDTVNSLILSLLPPVDFGFHCQKEQSIVDTTDDIKLYTLRLLVQYVRRCSGLHIPFVPVDELQSDAEQVFAIVECDPEFQGIMKDLEHHKAKDAVHEAVNKLHTAPEPDPETERVEYLDISPEGCLVVMLLQQWLVRHLTKRMMQLMTLEAFTEHRSKIPFSYLENYLVHQAHFSLTSLIDRYLMGLTNKWEPKFPTSKVLCFTRSSPLIHQLPAQYPSHALERQSDDDIKQTLKNLVHEAVDRLMVCKLSNIPSQSHVLELLRSFVHSDTAEVLLLVVNMQEIRQQVINHIRIMIEEEEALLLKEDRKQKLFLLLLHFPPSKFANACYPSLFLRGWDHCYLDTVAHSTATGVIDIRRWFWDCCFLPDTLPPPDEDSLITTLKEILNEAIPILASRVFFGVVHNGHFNMKMSGSKRTKILKTLLFDKGMGNVLCERFRSYWKPNVMSEYLEKAVAFTRSKDSTLNITDSIHTTFKSLFFDFLVYMISRINEDCNIDILFLPSCTPATQSLFLDIVRVFKIPKLSELKVRSAHPQLGKEASYLPQFPFFKTVSGEVERLVEDSREEANTKTNIMGDLETDGVEQSITYRGLTNQQSLIRHLKEIVVRKLKVIVESEEKSFLAHSLKAQEENPVIWDYYFSDFIARTLHLESSEGISQRILRAFFTQLQEEETALEMVAQLHVYMNVYHLELAKMATVLRPLDRIQHVSRAAPNALSPLVTSPTKQLVDVVQETKHPLGTPEHLSAFVVGHLFNALVGAAFGQKSPSSPNLINNPDKMLMWYKAYRDVMCLPSLKQHVYSALSPGAQPAMAVVEARLNVMQTVFLALRSFSDPARAEPSEPLLADSQKIFHTLFNRHFDEDMELKNGCPRLGGVSEVGVEVITQTGPSPKPQEERDNNQIRLLMEGLFSHFFSADRRGYHEEDMRWFLELANQQDDWCVPHVSDVVIGGTSEQDLLDELQKSIYEKEKSRTATLTVEIPKDAISMCTFKMYLSRLLGECDRQNEDPVRCGPLLLHQYHPRLQVGQALVKKATLGSSGPYIPTFYQESPAICPEQASLGRRMQQPLAHLYFLTVLEHVLAEEKSLANMAKAARQLSDLVNSGASSDPAQQAVLQIELQAVLQVVAKLLAKLLGAESDERAQFVELKDSIEDINRLFGDVSTGGERVGSHGMVVALHLLKVLKSSRKFIELMTTKFEMRCREIKCLWPIHERLQQEPGESTVHLLPFMLPVGRGEDDLRGLYKRVKKAMVGIHQLDHTNNIKELERIATECNSPRRMSGGTERLSPGKRVNRHCNFKMMMWLVIFYEFFDKGKQSPTLCNVIGSKDFSQSAGLQKSEIRLFQCFLDTRLMQCRPEDPNTLRLDEEVLEVGPGGRLRRKQPRDRQKMVDPLHELFLPPDPTKIDQSDRDLRYALANLVAVVLGCEPESNHLWYHLFDQEPLWNTYLTGFMYRSKINKDGLLYDCGVELTPDGHFGRQDYHKHANRGTYTLHSLYLLLWANFGAFCMALLVLPDADKTVHGPLISDWLSVRHYCISQLRTVWMHIRNNLGISDEERSFLIMRCMKTLYEVSNSDTSDPETRRGVFTSIEQLDSYERLWHARVYRPSRDEMTEKFIQYSNLMQHAVFVEMRNLELRYPYFPSEQDFTHSVLSSGDVVCEDIALLSRFSLQWRRLQAGGELLPDLVELYQWLHTDLAHLVSYDKACTVTIRKVINRAVKKYSRDRGQYLEQLFVRVKEGYNKYVELIGGAIGVGACAAVRQGNKIYTIDDDIPLLHFLTDVEEEEQGNDWLFTVIADIITAHNDMVELPRQVASQPFKRLLPQQQSTAYPTEIATANCIIPHFKMLHGVNELVQLLRSRHRNILHTYPSFSLNVARQQQSATMSLGSAPSPSPASPLFHLQELQEDIVVSFLAGKPFILDVSELRTLFKFKVSVPRALQHKADVISSDELAAIQERLPEELKGDMDQEFCKRLEFEFHPADYHVMLATTTGLKTAANHLVKFVINNRVEALNLRQTLADFLLSLYDGLNSFKDALSEIGIQKLTNNQVVCLSELPLVHLYHCLRVFATWMEQGMYDFSALPYTLKTHLQPNDLSTLKAIPTNWEASMSELMSEVESMNSLLSHIEGYITSQDAGQTETPITAYLRNLKLISDDERLPQHIPNSVLLQHFVEFRITLRGIMSEVQQRVDQEAKEKEAAEREPKHWKEVVEDIWDEFLPHFRGAMYTGDGLFLYDAAEGYYLYQKEDGDEEEDDLMEGGDEEEEEGLEREKEREEGEEDDEFSVIPDEGISEAERVAEFTPERVAELLKGIGLSQYAQSFLDSNVNGETLMEVGDDDLRDAGVLFRLHQVKIITVFKRVVTGESPTGMTVDNVVDFLKKLKLDTYVNPFRANGVDGDILEAILARDGDKVMIESIGREMKVTDIILEELGVTNGIHRAKIRTFKKFLSGSLASVRSSVKTTTHASTSRASVQSKGSSRTGKRTS